MDLDHAACYRALRTRDSRFDGRFFVAVRTTGIYCRPICPARTPRPENIVFYPTAAAAHEAGYRPCLRCRPETAPDLAAWRGTANTVSRALALIEGGALDADDVDALAGRLGIGERQLRRLFRDHLGASPIAVAQTRRVLLAKQLLHETQLPITDVALAAGFGSIRRFNETFQTLFGRPPGALRRAGATAIPPRRGEVTLLLRCRPPYDWPAMLSFFAARAIAGIEVVRDGSYARTFTIDGAQGEVVVARASADALRATIRLPRLQSLPGIIARLRQLFDLAADPSAIAAQLSEDPLLAPLVAARPGLRVPGAWDGLELAVRAVLGQQVTVAAARRLLGRLVARCGEPLRTPSSIEGLTHVFPAAAAITEAGVRDLGVPRSRMQTLVAVASAMHTNPRMLERGAPLESTLTAFRGIAGVGEWTTEYVAMRQLRATDAFPAGDAGLLRALSTRLGRRATKVELAAVAERWRPWRAYAAQHLWTSLSAGGPEPRSRVPTLPSRPHRGSRPSIQESGRDPRTSIGLP
jgi:AraC family transcriptional regulator, regulatory protein of adaptative response / DNA-3-methyladenine glycosylase II